MARKKSNAEPNPEVRRSSRLEKAASSNSTSDTSKKVMSKSLTNPEEVQKSNAEPNPKANPEVRRSSRLEKATSSNSTSDTSKKVMSKSLTNPKEVRRSLRLGKAASLNSETTYSSRQAKRARSDVEQPEPHVVSFISNSVSDNIITSSYEMVPMNDYPVRPVSEMDEGPVPSRRLKRRGERCSPIHEGPEEDDDDERTRSESEKTTSEEEEDLDNEEVGNDRGLLRKKKEVTGRQMSFLNYLTFHQRTENPPKNLVQDFKVKLSQRWSQLPAEEKNQYVYTDKEGYSSASYSEGNAGNLYKLDTRSSPHRFKSLIGDFNEEKLQACRELRFGPLLKLAVLRMHPSILRVIVDATSPSKRSITMHGTELQVSANDVETVMGLKNDGAPVVFNGSVRDHPELEAIADEMEGLDKKIQLSKVGTYLRETQLVDDKFKRLFVLFTMSTIICPTASLSIPKKWLLVVRNPADCAAMNWAEFAFNLLMAGISEFQEREINKKTNGRFCSGCLLFLQLFYLNCVGPDKHFVDRSLYPIEAWGEKQVGKALKYINSLGGIFSGGVGWKKVGERVAVGVNRQQFHSVIGRVGQLEEHVRRISEEMGQGFSAILSRLDSMAASSQPHGAAGPSKARGRGKKKEVPVDLNGSPPKKVTIILSDSTSIVSPDKVLVPKKINIGPFLVFGDIDVIDKGVVTYVCSTKQVGEKIVHVVGGDIWGSRRQVQSLKPDGWVVDDVINMFSNYLTQEQKERDETPRSHFFSTFFAQRIQGHCEGVRKGEAYGFLSKRILGIRAAQKEIEQCDKLFIPVNDNGSHWFLVVLRLDLGRAEIWDSIRHGFYTRSDICKTILQALDFATGDLEFKFKKVAFTQFQIYNPTERPIQQNGSDCGVYVIKHIKHFGSRWWTGYDSHTIHMELMIELVRNKHNLVWPAIEKQFFSPPTANRQQTEKKGSVKNPTRRLRRPSDVRRSH